MNDLNLLFEKIRILRSIVITHILWLESRGLRDEETSKIHSLAENHSTLANMFQAANYKGLIESDDLDIFLGYVWRQRNNLAEDAKEIFNYIFEKHPKLMRWVLIW